MPKQFWGLTSCLALVALLTSACQPSPTVTATFTLRTRYDPADDRWRI